MKNFSFSMAIAIVLLIFFIIIAVCPFNLVDMKQAQRIIMWKSKYQQLDYSFSLVNMHEGNITKLSSENEKLSDELFVEKIKPYFNLADEHLISYKNYQYRRKNGRLMPKNSQFYFDKFLKSKDGSLISFKKNLNYMNIDVQPVFYMFIDINGEKKPNRIGYDIFFLDIFEHKIEALGYDKDYSKIKYNCSPIGSGLYCSEFYLLGGHF